jgi:signal peptidase I
MKKVMTMRPARQRWFLALGGGLIGLLAIVHSHYRLSLVVGDSMRPTFNTGDLLLVDKWAYRTSGPRRGDIVIVRYERDLVIKRVVGLPGERIEIKNSALYINDALIVENHTMVQGRLNIGRGDVFAGNYAILGDNRAFPPAQTIHAIVPKNRILGKVVYATRLRGPPRKAWSVQGEAAPVLAVGDNPRSAFPSFNLDPMIRRSGKKG